MLSQLENSSPDGEMNFDSGCVRIVYCSGVVYVRLTKSLLKGKGEFLFR